MLGKDIVSRLNSDALVHRFEVAPAHIIHEVEVGFAVQHLKANDYLLSIARKDPDSLLSAMSNVAGCGLSLNPAEKCAYLVPRKGKICFDPSYMGLIRLATNSGSIEWVQAYAVHAGDKFALREAGEPPIFESDPFSDRGEFKGVFCVAKTKGGDYLTTTMSAAEVYEVRDTSEAYKNGTEGKRGPWESHFLEMAKKSVVRRAFKMWPMSNENENDRMLAEAIHISNENEGIEFPKTSPDLGQYNDTEKAYYDQLIESSDAVGMVVFKHSVTERTWTNLYHSFERPKGKYQALVDELYRKGESMVRDCTDEINEAVANGQDIAEMVDDLGELYDLVADRVSNEARMEMVAQKARIINNQEGE